MYKYPNNLKQVRGLGSVFPSNGESTVYDF